MSTHDELRRAALEEFVDAGYVGASISSIATRSGVSKAAVLYHFESKGQLLSEVVEPSLDRLDAMTERLESAGLNSEALAAFVEEFVDFLLQHRREVTIVLNYGAALSDIPVMARATASMQRLADFFQGATDSVQEKLRFALALGGSAFGLVVAARLDVDELPDDEVRTAFLQLMWELLAPVLEVANIPAPSWDGS